MPKRLQKLWEVGEFWVELFICGDEVLFSEVSPRPHDTGMVTMISQDLSQFAFTQGQFLVCQFQRFIIFGPSASSVILVKGESKNLSFGNLNDALSEPDTQLGYSEKPEVKGHRRMGVGLGRGIPIKEARQKAKFVSEKVSISL